MTERQRRGRTLAMFSMIVATWAILGEPGRPNTAVLMIAALGMLVALALMWRTTATPSPTPTAAPSWPAVVVEPPRPQSPAGSSVPREASVGGALTGCGLGCMMLVYLGLAGSFAAITASQFLNAVWQFALPAIGVGAFFGYGWPRWSWRWGFVLGWALLLVVAIYVADLVSCLTAACTPGQEDTVPAALIVLFLVLLFASAYAGSVVRLRRGT